MATNGHITSLGQSSRIGALKDALLDCYTRDNSQSLKYNIHAKAVIPSGTTRAVLSYTPFPLGFSGGHGTYVTSLDGDEYLDLVSEHCAGMYGHSHPAIKEAIEKVLRLGHSLGGTNPQEAELAEKLVSRFPSIDMIRFCNSGNEANTFAIATALSFNQRQKVMVFENGYHGGSLMFPAIPSPLNIPHQFVIGRFNDIERTRGKIEQNIGVILVEPMQGAGGSILATKEFLTFLREEATRVGAILIFDEVITSRVYYGGLQEYFGVIPDMTTIGKHFGGGLAFGAFGGRRDIMQQYEMSQKGPLFHSGTWNNNRFTVAAGSVGTSLLTREALNKANHLGDKLRVGLKTIFESKDPPVGFVRGFGSVVGFGFNGPDAEVLREAFFYYMVKERIYIGPRGFIALNILHEREHIERALDAVRCFVEDAFV